MEYLQQELDEMHPENITDVRKLQKKIEDSGMNETARREADKVLSRMKQEGQNSPEYGNLYNYLDFMTSLSWKKAEMKPIDLNKAEAILNEDHYGLKKVKERVLQQIAVMDLNKKQSGSILLFVGAPGTGKTSIGKSIAKAPLWAACVMRPISAAIGEPISALCRAVLWMELRRPVQAIR